MKACVCTIFACFVAFAAGYWIAPLRPAPPPVTRYAPATSVTGHLSGSARQGRVWVLHQPDGRDVLVLDSPQSPPAPGKITVGGTFAESFDVEGQTVRVFLGCELEK